MASTFSSPSTSGSFESFHERWLHRHHTLLNELLKTQETCKKSRDDQDAIKGLIDRVITHYQEYLEANSSMANRHTFLVFSPTWLTPLEKALLWIAGFKPGLMLNLVMSSVRDLSENQRERIENLKNMTKQEEKLLAGELASIHESVAAPPVMELAKEEGRRHLMDEEVRESDEGLESLREGLRSLLSSADQLRVRTVRVVVETLSPIQNVRFFAAAMQFQLRLRTLEQERQGLDRVASE